MSGRDKKKVKIETSAAGSSEEKPSGEKGKPGRPRKKHEYNRPEVVERDKLSRQDAVLDSLARLLQNNSKNCISCCLVDGVILIASNTIHYQSAGEKQYIGEVMSYFKKEADSYVPRGLDKEKDDRIKIFQTISRQKVHGEEQGYIKLHDEKIEEMARDVLLTKESKQAGYLAKLECEDAKNRRELSKYLLLAYAIIRQVKRDFRAVERRIIKNSADQLAMALKRGHSYENVAIKDKHQINAKKQLVQGVGGGQIGRGYCILKVDAENVHAEARLVEYLIYTGYLTKEGGEKFYVGISKLSCHGCHKLIDAICRVLGDRVFARGNHDLVFPWCSPAILDNVVSTSANTKAAKSADELIQKIREAFGNSEISAAADQYMERLSEGSESTAEQSVDHEDIGMPEQGVDAAFDNLGAKMRDGALGEEDYKLLSVLNILKDMDINKVAPETLQFMSQVMRSSQQEGWKDKIGGYNANIAKTIETQKQDKGKDKVRD